MCLDTLLNLLLRSCTSLLAQFLCHMRNLIHVNALSNTINYLFHGSTYSNQQPPGRSVIAQYLNQVNNILFLFLVLARIFTEILEVATRILISYPLKKKTVKMNLSVLSNKSKALLSVILITADLNLLLIIFKTIPKQWSYELIYDVLKYCPQQSQKFS